MKQSLADHVARHPLRLLLTVIAVGFSSWLLAGWAIVHSFDDAHRHSTELCRSLNELRRDIYIAAADLGVPAEVRERFLPTRNCEDLP